MEFTKCNICGAGVSVDNINEHEFQHEFGKVTMMVGDEIVLIKTREELKKLQKRVRKRKIQ